jgi:hypothetical protein
VRTAAAKKRSEREGGKPLGPRGGARRGGYYVLLLGPLSGVGASCGEEEGHYWRLACTAAVTRASHCHA